MDTGIINDSVRVRRHFNIDCTKPINIFDELSHQPNVTIAYLPLSDKIGGFSHNEKGHYLIFINSNHCAQRQNFSCAHELYHLFFEYDDNFVYHAKKNSECNANKFAGAFLIPQESLYIYLQINNINPRQMDKKQLTDMQRYFGVSNNALCVRLMEEKLISKEISSYYNDIGEHYKKIKGKYEIKGEYVELARELYHEGKISDGKYNEILSNMFCYGLMYRGCDNGFKGRK